MYLQLWSWGSNDDLALGRQTDDVEGVDSDKLESTPARVQGLGSDFIAVTAASGDCMSVVVGSQGQLRIWGTFRVCSRSFIHFNASSIYTRPKTVTPASMAIQLIQKRPFILSHIQFFLGIEFARCGVELAMS